MVLPNKAAPNKAAHPVRTRAAEIKLGLVHSGMISCDLDTSENSLRSNLLQITVLPDLHYQDEKRYQVGASGRFPAGDITASSCRYSSRVESATNIDVIYKIEVIKPVSNAKTSTAQWKDNFLVA
jgi:hypothetical protein